MWRNLFVASFTVLSSSLPLSASAQGGRAARLAQVSLQLTGTIKDDAGAVLPGVEVVLSQENVAGVAPRTVMTDASGRYLFTDLPAGTFRIEARLSGFAPAERTGIALAIGPAVSVDVVLRRGSRATPPPVEVPTVRPVPPPPTVTVPPPDATSPITITRPPPVPAAPAGLAVVPVFYATDRNAMNRETTISYGSARNPKEALALGRFDVSVPRDHKMGQVERPTIWTLYAEDPTQHFAITSRRLESYEEFYADVRGVVSRSTRKDVFVFIHGYNVAFEDAVYRTAQIAYDLGFDGAPVLYSWPSNTGETPIGYTTAQNNNDWTVTHLRWFLNDVRAKTGAARIHLIAHSMGNRALVNALTELPSDVKRKFNQIVLTAPDIDAQTFVQLADAVRRNSERVTLYASASDKALLLSKRLNAYARAGDAGAGLVIVPGIDTIDVTSVDSDFIGHYYYGDNRSVVSDIFLLLTQGLSPSNRPMLRSEGVLPRLFWRFEP